MQAELGQRKKGYLASSSMSSACSFADCLFCNDSARDVMVMLAMAVMVMLVIQVMAMMLAMVPLKN